ncbi:ATP-grasp domain-containing protein [Metabacillus halosaccharovorans]|uniref:ATP-grasp domain-containing protein n=1 Tax=Metabacillus halosaccharovorans TaxID=930124 RepID=A0ABT3DCI7_9BACI|nr:ATP-grasp domain-containing protein [Metabacillus halosaccharovorans]MCV9884672.1 ATP-grasp domain-containing protein [Metabacillus halosaccharovorans]
MNLNKKKFLIVGGGYADIPLIISAKKIGYYVITTGNRPDDIGHKYSDEYHQVDFSDCKAIYELAKKLNVSAICPSCNDFALMSATYAAERLGLPGYDSYEIARTIHHKDEFRKFALANNIQSPKAFGFSNVKDAIDSIGLLDFPVIVKPVDLTGGKGITVINDKEKASAAIQKAFEISKNKRIVIEEFVNGSRHGFSAFLYKGKVKFYFSDNEHYYLNPYMVSAASSPSIASNSVEKKLGEVAERIASLLSLKDGIFHVQYIIKNNEPIIIEICRRPPGDLYIKFVEYATNVDYPTWIVKAFAGMDISGLSYSPTNGYFTRHCIMSSKRGKIKDIHYHPSIVKNIIDEYTWWKKGDMVTDLLTNKMGIVFLEFETFDEMIRKTNELNDLIKVQIE